MAHAVINGVYRKVRGGRLYRPPRKTPPTPAEIRKIALSKAKTEAEEKFPELLKVIDGLAEKLKQTSDNGRRYYNGVLKEIYKRAYTWKDKKMLDRRGKIIAALRGRTHRKNSTTLGEFVGAVSERAERNSKTASRWATQLNAALKDDIKPKALTKYLRNF